MWKLVQLAGGQTRCGHGEWNSFWVRGQNGEMRGAAELLRIDCFGSIDVETRGSWDEQV